MSYQYQVYYDYETEDGTWKYNNIHSVFLVTKGSHDIADEIAKRKLEQELNKFRITKVTCD